MYILTHVKLNCDQLVLPNVVDSPSTENVFLKYMIILLHRMKTPQGILLKKKARSQNRKRFVLPGAPEILTSCKNN